MSEPKDLIEQLRRSNRRWKALALAACSVLVLAALAGFVAMARDQMRPRHSCAMQQEGANAIKAARARCGPRNSCARWNKMGRMPSRLRTRGSRDDARDFLAGTQINGMG